VYWTLKAAGLQNLSILNGGVKAWRAANLPLTTEPATVAPSGYTAKIDPRLVATQEEVARVIGTNTGACSTPGRPPSSSRDAPCGGEDPGTLVGAKNVDNAVWFAKAAARCCRHPM